MPDKTQNKVTEPENSETPAESKEPRIRFSMSKVILTICGLLIGAAALLMTLGQSVLHKGAVVLDDAFVHGAVTHVGIAENARIEALRVGLGDTVDAGEVIAVLESDELRANERKAEADLSRMQVELQRAEVADALAKAVLQSDRRQAEALIAAAEARMRAASAKRDLANGNLERTNALADRGLVADTELEEAREAARSAEAELARRVAELNRDRGRLVEVNLGANQEKLRSAERDVLRARIAEGMAELDRRKAALEKSEVDAKTAGIVVDISSRAGSSVRPNDPIISIWDTNQVWMRAWVSEDEVSRIKIGDKAVIEIDALSDVQLEGTVHRILVAEDGQERTLPGQPISPLLPNETRFAVQVSLEPNVTLPRELLPGMSGSIRIMVQGSDMPRKGILSEVFAMMDLKLGE